MRTNADRRPRYDVAVVGAGPAGCASARRLAQSGCRVLLLERTQFEAVRVGESLAPGVQPLLAELGVWRDFLDLAPLPSYGTRSVWGAPDPQQHSHLATAYLNGWHVDRVRFDRMLATSAVQAGAELHTGARLLDCAQQVDGNYALRWKCGETEEVASAGFIVDATGRGSTLARRFNARHCVFDRLIGVAAQFADPDAGSHCYTLVETTPHGWWYSAPIGNDRSVAMLMSDGDIVRAGRFHLAQNWRAALQAARATTDRMSAGESCGAPQIYSAISQRLIRHDSPRERWLAVGDAALSVDPISGSGVIRALRTAQAGAAAVLRALQSDPAAIDEYEAERNRECTSYLFERSAYYELETRWASATFWKRRLGAVQVQ